MRNSSTKRILRFIDKALNRLKLREKIIGLFIFCVILPLITVDGLIIQRIVAEERQQSIAEAKEVVSTITNYFEDTISTCHNIVTSVDQNYKVGEILGKHYDSVFDYYENYHKMSENYFFQTLVRFNNMRVKLYTSNDTVVGGGYVGKIDEISDKDWYKAYKNSDTGFIFFCNYDDSPGYVDARRGIFYIGKLSYNNNEYENFVKIDLDYSTFARRLVGLGNVESVYVCDNDTILFASEGNNNLNTPFTIYDGSEKETYVSEVSNLGNINRIIVERNDESIMDYIFSNRDTLIIMLVLSILLPAFVLYEINYSIVYRIEELNRVFGKRENDVLVKVDEPDGSDELGNLMTNYNSMVDEVNRLIQIVYKDRLKEQEMDIARQNAELLALHSQINPHFMFNALESIRMHSLIKGEEETAEMVEKLALMERQYVNWDSDMITLGQELASVEAYLILQKYRFGDRLKYELSVDKKCEDHLIPKLTVVTFVENACVHGMENKTSECFVFLRVYKKGQYIEIEVEDTGNGMPEDKLNEIKVKAKTIELDDLKNGRHVGIYNALLRLKMTMGEGYRFDMESEEGIGTMIQISIPDDTIVDEQEGDI